MTRKTLRIQRNKTTIAAQEIWSRETSNIIEKEVSNNITRIKNKYKAKAYAKRVKNENYK
jgi:hypothetical protein